MGVMPRLNVIVFCLAGAAVAAVTGCGKRQQTSQVTPPLRESPKAQTAAPVDAVGRALWPELTTVQFRERSRHVGLRTEGAEVTFTVDGARWRLHEAEPPAEVPDVAATGELLASVEGEVLYPGKLADLLGALPVRAVTYEFRNEREAPLIAALREEGWEPRQLVEEERQRTAEGSRTHPTPASSRLLPPPAWPGLAEDPPSMVRGELGGWITLTLVREGPNGAVLQLMSWDTGAIPTTPPPQ